jgi:hypothetical protein
MTTSDLQTFTLTPHPLTQGSSARSIRAQISWRSGVLKVSYLLEGDLERLRVPDRQRPRFADELWRHTCFEMFVARKDEAGYHEFNFSPSSEWATYVFVRYRERVAPGRSVELADMDPHVIVRRFVGKLELDAEVELERLGSGFTDGKLVLGLSAVVEEVDGSLSYWALHHPGAKPDFHHPDAFVLELDEIRN